MTTFSAFAVLWSAFIASWAIAALWSGRPASRAGGDTVLPLMAVQLVGFTLALGSEPLGLARLLDLWTPPEYARWGLVGLAALGLAVCWWARLHLGRLWSAGVDAKAGHRIVDTGPYALVRHPIYSGLILASTATALSSGSLPALAGAALLAAGFRVKAGLEERFLANTLGAEAYAGYARRTPMLVPGPRL